MKKPSFARLVAIAVEQDQVVTRKQLLITGFSDDRVQRMVDRGLWLKLQRGVYLLGPGPATWRQLARAAQWAGGKQLALDGAAALVWHGIDVELPELIELTVLSRKGRPEPTGVSIREPSRTLRTVKRDRVLVVSVEDALLNYAARCDDDEKVEDVVEASLNARKTAERKLWEFIARNSKSGVRGVVRLRTVMANRPNGKPARSILELEVLRLIRRSGLPVPARNVDVIDANGDRREIDLCYVEQRGAIEVDSKRFHSTRTQKSRDRSRQLALEAVGYNFVRVTWVDVFQDPDWVIEQLRGLLARVVAA